MPKPKEQDFFITVPAEGTITYKVRATDVVAAICKLKDQDREAVDHYIEAAWDDDDVEELRIENWQRRSISLTNEQIEGFE